MKTIHVNASKSYDILIERGILERAGEEIKKVCGAGEALIVSDDTVWGLFGEAVLASMQKAGFDVTSFTFPHGEQSKNLSVYADMLQGLEVYWGISPVMSARSQSYWERKNHVVFPHAFEPTLDWSIGFAKEVMDFAEREDANVYLMPIKTNLEAYLAGVLA